MFHAVAGALWAASTERDFDIPAGPPADTLKIAAQQGGVEILISTAVPENVYTRPVKGRYTAREALGRMLQDTPYEAVPVSEGKAFGIVLKRPPRDRDDPAQQGREKLDPNPVTPMQPASTRTVRISSFLKGVLAFAFASSPQLPGQEVSDEVTTLNPFEVRADSENTLWSVNQSSGGTRVAVAVKELPFSLDVLTAEFMDDFIVSDVSEVLTQVGNVSGLESYTGAGSGNAIRGFSQYYQLRNGFYRNGVIDKTLVSRVEVIKGPYAAIYGRGEPGGVINYISKRPVFGRNSGKLVLELGENSTQRVQLEHNLALTRRTAVLFAGSYLEREFDQMFTHERSRNFGAVLRHRFSPQTEVLVEYEHMYRRNNRGRPVTDMRVSGLDPTDGTRNKYLGEFANDFIAEYGWINTLGPMMYSDRTLDTLNVTLTHQFSPNLNLRLAYNDSRTEQDYDYQALGGSTIEVDPLTRKFVRWSSVPAPRWRRLPADVSNVQADLTFDFETGDVKHSTLLTFDYNTQLNGRITERAPRGRATDVHTVDYGSGPVPNYTNDAGSLHGPRTDPIPAFDTTINYFDTPQYYTWVSENRTLDYDITGVFLMHRARFFNDKLLLMAGGRFDKSKTVIIDRLSPDMVTETNRTDSEVDDLTYNVGLNYNVTPQTILFGSHSTSFNPKGDVFSHTGEPMPNENGEGYELGFRTAVRDGQIDLGVSYFHIERQNIRIRNPDFDPIVDSPSDKPQFIAGGLDRAKGFEFYANGRVTDSLSLRVSAGTVDARHVKSLDAWREGLRLADVPEWNYAIGASYRLREGRLKGLSLNASWRSQSSYRIGDAEPTPSDRRNNLRTGEGGILDLAAGYGWRSANDRLSHRVRLAMKNALDHIFVEGSGYYSLSRQVTASYTLEY